MGRSSGLTGDDVYAILHNKVGSDEGGSGQDGVGISSIVKTGTEGLVDTYTITLTNNSTYTFTVTNGEDGANATDEQVEQAVSEYLEANPVSVNGALKVSEHVVLMDISEG